MADLIVQPSLQLKETDILTVDMLNLMATPVVSLAVETPVTDENFFRNGNNYSSFWTTPAGMTCPVNTETQNSNYWYVNPHGAAVTCKRSTEVPDLYSLWSLEIDGAVGVTDCSVGQQINGDLSATLRRPCTFSGYIENNSGALLNPKLEIWTANAFNLFSACTLQTTVNLQSVANGSWAYDTVTVDLSTITNVANGLFVKVRIPSGALSQPTYRVNFARLKFQLGEVATNFVDDPSLFIQAPSVDSTMLQDGCIARPSLFLNNVVPSGAYVAKSIKNGDIADGQIDARTLANVSTTLSAAFTQPAVGSNVSIQVGSTAGFIAGSGDQVRIAVGGLYWLISVTDGTHLVVQNTAALGNATSGTSVPTGGAVTFSAVTSSLGYTPVNKAGDSMTTAAKLYFTTDTAVGSGAAANAAILVNSTTTNQANDGYFPAIAFNRPSTYARTIGLSTTGRFKTVDHLGAVGYLLDTVTKVDGASIQNSAITYAHLAQSLINFICPCGMIMIFAGPSPPSGWFVCDGHEVSRTTYSTLFTALGVYWGAGDNVNTFNLPDLRGRAPVGYVNTTASPPLTGGITARGFGTKDGFETHTLTIAQLASHNHATANDSHSHTLHNTAHSHTIINPVGGLNAQPGSGQYSAFGNTNTDSLAISMWADAAASGITIQNNGSNAPHNNMQPVAVLYYIIKAT